MTASDKRLAAVMQAKREEMLRRLVQGGRKDAGSEPPARPAAIQPPRETPESHYRFEKFQQYYHLQLQRAVAERAGIATPFFLMHEGVARDTTVVDGQTLLNFATYNYLDLNGDARLAAAAQAAIERFGTSASASRLVSGERPPHRELEHALAALHGVEDAVAFVSGHATNVTTIGSLFGPRDLILHDRLAHNSIIQGARLSGAARQAFPHNDWRALDALLAEMRPRYEKVLIVVEGLYSMDGDVCPLDRLVEVKRRHKALLMVDEAHSIGVLGAQGRGVGEHFGIPGHEVDVWMGTLSKTLAGCGGYVAGSRALVEMLKFTAPGFVYSVGMPPPVAAACTAALEAMLAEPWRVERLRANGRLFLALAREHGLDTGLAEGYNVVPVVVGRSELAARLSNRLMERGINVQPIIYPAVEEKAARLRFFLSCAHAEEQIREAVRVTAEELAALRAQAPRE